MFIKKSVPKTAHMTLKESMIRLLSSTEHFGTNLISLNLRRFAIKTSRLILKRAFTCLQTPLWKNLL